MPNKYSDIILTAIAAEGTIAPDANADGLAYATQLWGDPTTWGGGGTPTMMSAQDEAETCVDNALGAPDIYKNIMYDYFLKAGLFEQSDTIGIQHGPSFA